MGGIACIVQDDIRVQLHDLLNVQVALSIDRIAGLQKLWGDKELCDEYSKNCKGISFDTINEYYEKIMKVYR